MAADEIDTSNKFMIGMHGDGLVFMRPVPRRMSQQEALLLAAWLVSIVGDDELWARTLKAVQNT